MIDSAKTFKEGDYFSMQMEMRCPNNRFTCANEKYNAGVYFSSVNSLIAQLRFDFKQHRFPAREQKITSNSMTCHFNLYFTLSSHAVY